MVNVDGIVNVLLGIFEFSLIVNKGIGQDEVLKLLGTPMSCLCWESLTIATMYVEGLAFVSCIFWQLTFVLPKQEDDFLNVLFSLCCLYVSWQQS